MLRDDVELFSQGLLGKTPLLNRTDKQLDPATELQQQAARASANEPSQERQRAARGALMDLLLQNMRMIKHKLEKKKREQTCKLSKEQIKALKEYRQQQREFPFKVHQQDIEE